MAPGPGPSASVCRAGWESVERDGMECLVPSAKGRFSFENIPVGVDPTSRDRCAVMGWVTSTLAWGRRSHAHAHGAGCYLGWSCWRECLARVSLLQKVPSAQRRWPSVREALPISPKQMTWQPQACRSRSSKQLGCAQQRRPGPSISCPAACQRGSLLGLCRQPDWRRQMWGDSAGAPGRPVQGPSVPR